MKLSRLLAPLGLPCPETDLDLTGLTCDSRQVAPGMLFAALPGAHTQGAQFIPEAVRRGAAAVLTNGPALPGVPTVSVPDPRDTLALMAGEFYGHPDRELTLIAVTGTKGKTTTAHMLRDILTAAGHKTGMVGTLGAFVGDTLLEETGNTTPEPVTLHRLLRRMVDGGCTHVVMEVSSQAMKLGRTVGMEFTAGVFLNLSPDHIGPGEHADFEEYRACKAALFRQCALAVGNAGDPSWPYIKGQIPPGVPVFTFGFEGEAHLRCAAITPDPDQPLSTLVSVAGTPRPYQIPMPGWFNGENALAAIALSRALGVEDGAVREGLAQVSVPGRTQVYPTDNGVFVLIDYAHNGESFRALLSALRPHVPGRIILVFGAGGDRPPMRRRDMGLAAAEGADWAVLTEDNPRSEVVEDICAQIAEKLHGRIPYQIIPDRRRAIRCALAQAHPGDLVALLGKGHEGYIEACGVRRPFSERAILDEYFREGRRGE
ncbi:MAG TPA: UDP-N-acetylmuramoyl-L-alanyl-D-glutamate--2,6-diaminopimelate ligase [Candidatus Enterenecus stercoripullorum]|nr:UDP-N-acetylmuramoyl-L-alanyl-D-glutamate--2,6-diaminopimelate ligase [Candidatus Enterenecus stercoripullorum]